MNDSIVYAQAVRRLIAETGLPLKKAAEAMGLPKDRILGWWSDSHLGLGYSSLEGLCQYLSISEDSLLSGQWDQAVIRKRIFEGVGALPERYSIEAHSYVRASAHIVEYFSLIRGRHAADRLLQEMNVSPLSLENLNNRVNILFITDLLKGLERRGFDDRAISHLGSLLFLTLSDTPLGQKFSQARNYVECYSVVAESLSLFDENFIYSGEFQTGGFALKARLNHEKIAGLSLSPLVLNKVLRYRKVVLDWFPYLSHLPPLKSQVRRCLSQGDDSCEYFVEFPRSKVKQKVSLLRSLGSLNSF